MLPLGLVEDLEIATRHRFESHIHDIYASFPTQNNDYD